MTKSYLFHRKGLLQHTHLTNYKTSDYLSSMVKAAQNKTKKVAKSKTSSSSSSSSSSSASSAKAAVDFECSPPNRKNGAQRPMSPILSADEQKLYTKFSIEIKQMAGLIILKCGLGIAEGPVQSQILQEQSFSKNFEKVYAFMCKDPIIGKHLSMVPLKFLNIGTSKAKEIMTGIKMRKKYSQMKTYMNNTLSVIWRKKVANLLISALAQ